MSREMYGIRIQGASRLLEDSLGLTEAKNQAVQYSARHRGVTVEVVTSGNRRVQATYRNGREVR